MDEDQKYIKNCVRKRKLPVADRISLKSYCTFYEENIEEHTIIVELENSSLIYVKCECQNVSHVMDIHEFYDKRSNDHRLKFPGAFNGINAYKNMKKGIINLQTLQNSNNGKKWERKTSRVRVLSFPFIIKALLEGNWYLFDITKFKGKTKMNPDIIVSYRVEKYILNFCLSEREEKNYFFLSNIIAFIGDNPRTKDQERLQVNRVIEEDSKGNILKCNCHNELFRKKLSNSSLTKTSIINKEKHTILMRRGSLVNSILISDDVYRVTYLVIDSNVEKILN